MDLIRSSNYNYGGPNVGNMNQTWINALYQVN